MTWGYIGSAAISVVGKALTSDSGGSSGGSAGGGGGGGGGGSSGEQAKQLDPRIAAMLFGSGVKTLKDGAVSTGTDENGQPIYKESDYDPGTGLLARYQSLLDKPQSAGLQKYGQSMDDYLGTNSAWDMNEARDSAFRLMKNAYDPVSMQAVQGGFTPAMQAAYSQMPQSYQAATSALAQAGPAATINAPGQNNLGLGKAFQDVIYGDMGNNPYLAGAIQKGLNQSAAQFQNLQSDAMQQFKEDILPSLRGDAIANGQYGGSRQGIAEGKAADSLARNMTRALSQVGQNMTDSAVAAQSAQFSQDRQNQLNAALGLSGQQYNVAGQDAGARNQVNLSNAQMANNNNQFNASAQNNVMSQLFNGALQNNQANAGFLQQANQNNYQGMQAMNLANLNYMNQANLQNGAWQLANNQLNSQNKLSGLSAVMGLTDNAFKMATNQNDYALNQATKINGLLTPYMGMSNSGMIPVQRSSGQGGSGSNGLNSILSSGTQLYKTLSNGNLFGSRGNPYNDYNQYSGGNDGWTLPDGESLGT
ncbi:hypothetical protein [Undibacterium sp. TJN19]|uniref:hypothetical protein n=1 Tax=Undibacterium sp. TJN19 TaxID=3413055 RepID=UPI003BF09226